MACRSPAVRLPFPWCAVFETIPQGHGMPWINQRRLPSFGFFRLPRVGSTKAVITALVSHKLNCCWILPREIPIVIDEENLTVFVQERGTGPTFSKYCWSVSLTLMTSSLAFRPVRWNVVTVMEHLCFQSRCLPHWDHFLGYCATHKQPRLFCLRLQDPVEFGHKIDYILEWECPKHSQQIDVPLTVCSCKFSCSHRSWLKLPGKVGVNTCSEEIRRHPLFQGQRLFTRSGWYRIGNIKRIDFQRFSQTDLLKFHRHLTCRIH